MGATSTAALLTMGLNLPEHLNPKTHASILDEDDRLPPRHLSPAHAAAEFLPIYTQRGPDIFTAAPKTIVQNWAYDYRYVVGPVTAAATAMATWTAAPIVSRWASDIGRGIQRRVGTPAMLLAGAGSALLASTYGPSTAKSLAISYTLNFPKYTDTGIEAVIDEYFGDVPMSASLTNVMITTHDLAGGIPGKPGILTNLDNPDMPIKSVLRATTAVPGFFPPYYLDGHIYLDGCVTMRNPTLRAKEYATERFAKSEDLVIISLGTGHSDHFTSRLVADDSVNQRMRLDHKSFRYYERFNPQLVTTEGDPFPITMDNVSEDYITNVIDVADGYIESLDEMGRLDDAIAQIKPDYR
ncbi:MAG: hypothetical protein ACI9BD_000523 [Candidatus Marinamargulisbacteria bacterium]|jgi:hypothetical protein